MKKIYFDNDVILDISIKRELDIKDSVVLLNLVEAGLFKGYTSSVIFTNTYYIQRKLVGHEISINFLKKLRLLLTVLNIGDLIIQKALESEFKDFEDAVQYFAAIENKMDCIITRNVEDYKNSTVPIYTPKEFLK
ncbi:MAG: PIN domain-containing protein, partial [Candidatus Fibromonas sp.]|nr:PIN domain-containing protein [Candidatus Fibromonas sp.]